MNVMLFNVVTTVTQDHIVGQQTCDDLPQTTINKSINDFRKRLNACALAGGGHFERMI